MTEKTLSTTTRIEAGLRASAKCPVAEGYPRASGGADTYYCTLSQGHSGPCEYPSDAWVRRCRLRVDGTQTGIRCVLAVGHMGTCSELPSATPP
jgi:hypothetical protein